MKFAHLRVIGLELNETCNLVLVVEWHETIYQLLIDDDDYITLLNADGTPINQSVKFRWGDCMYNKSNLAYCSVPAILSMIKQQDEHKRISDDLKHQ